MISPVIPSHKRHRKNKKETIPIATKKHFVGLKLSDILRRSVDKSTLTLAFSKNNSFVATTRKRYIYESYAAPCHMG
jgi:hypothetical protein